MGPLLKEDKENRREFPKEIRTAIGLLNSMVLSGESHSARSEKVVKEAMEILNNRSNENTI